MLQSFEHYFAGERLYAEVFSQYGPFNFFAERALFQVLHLPVDHDAGRLVTLILWLLSALLAGCFVYSLSKNTALASATGLAVVLLGRVLADTPGHPQQLILPILALACCLSISGRRVNLLLLGALGAALFFTKVNVGLFYLAAVAEMLLCEFPAGLVRRLGAGVMLLYFVGGPLILMRQHLREWASSYCLAAIVCGVSTLVVALRTTPPSTAPARSVVYVGAGAGLATALIVGETLRERMSFGTLVEGVLWAPLRHPRVFEVPFELSITSVLLIVVVSVCTVVLYGLRDRWRERADWVDALRCLTGLAVALFLAAVSHPAPKNPLLQPRACALAFLPLGLLPPKGRSWRWQESHPRLFVTSLAATQFLQAYPVAGDQVSIALAPLLLWAFICVHDGAGGLFSLLLPLKNKLRAVPHRQDTILGGFLAVAMLGFILRLGAWPGRYSDPPSHLRGAARLHIPAGQEALFESLATNIQANCSLLFTMPGFGSLNFWSGVPAPNGLNHNAWMRSLSPEQQQQILRVLEMNPRSCVVYNRDLVHIWLVSDQELLQLPLARYVLFDMRKVDQEGGYSIYVEQQRDRPWVEVGAGGRRERPRGERAQPQPDIAFP